MNYEQVLGDHRLLQELMEEAKKEDGDAKKDPENFYTRFYEVRNRLFKSITSYQKKNTPQPKKPKMAKDQKFVWPMWPKIVQANSDDVYVVGGNDTTPTTQFSVH